MEIGAIYLGNNTCRFTIWSPWAKNIQVKLLPEGTLLQLTKDDSGYWTGVFDNIAPGSDYLYRLNNGIERPDPASGFQPVDVHSASRVVDHNSYEWGDDKWKPPELKDFIIYELHAGTFTPEGTFTAAAGKIKHLKTLGITAVEIMPVSQFPGERNWGYDGVYPFAPQNSYGGPEGLKYFVDMLHRNGIAAILDVVYNHFGPEGNYLHQYGPYFTPRYITPWGNAVNFDGEYSDEVRNYFLQNARSWFKNYHFDGLRLDAVDKIYDMGVKHFLQELSEETKRFSEESGKKRILIAESDLNDEKVIRPLKEMGYGIDAQWCDDFHHAIHSVITGEKEGYYADFGRVSHIVKSLMDSFVYDGQYSVFRKRKHGNCTRGRNLSQFIVNLQNHDQIGNRAFGERMSSLVSFENYKLASSLLILSPYLPLIFMGQEFYEEAPFLFFISHSDPELIKAVYKGRIEEFSSFKWEGEIPDPFAEDTFMNSKIGWDFHRKKESSVIYDLYRVLIEYRKNNPVFKDETRENITAEEIAGKKVILLHRTSAQKSIYYVMNFEPETVTISANVPEGNWRKKLDTSALEWLGPGVSTEKLLIGKTQNMTLRRESFILYEQE